MAAVLSISFSAALSAPCRVLKLPIGSNVSPCFILTSNWPPGVVGGAKSRSGRPPRLVLVFVLVSVLVLVLVLALVLVVVCWVVCVVVVVVVVVSVVSDVSVVVS